MNMKLIGALLMMLGCGGVGFSMTKNHKKEENAMLELCRSLEWMILELNYRMPPLSSVCRGAADVCKGCISRVFERLANELDRQITPDAYACMVAALASVPGVPERVTMHLKDLGTSFGKFDLQGQISGLETTLALCKGELQIMKNGREVRLRTYQTLGLCAGAALVILLL